MKLRDGHLCQWNDAMSVRYLTEGTLISTPTNGQAPVRAGSFRMYALDLHPDVPAGLYAILTLSWFYSVSQCEYEDSTFNETTTSCFQILTYQPLITILISHSMQYNPCCWTYLSAVLQPFVGPWPLFQFLDLFTQSVGLLGWGISPSQGRYLHTGQHKHKKNVYRHPYLKWDSNPRFQCSCLRPSGHCDRLVVEPEHLNNLIVRQFIYLRFI
jgi:hypothetical protein